MKKVSVFVIVVMFILLNLTSCGVLKGDLELNYGKGIYINEEKLQPLNSVEWTVDDESIVNIKADGAIVGIAPGNTTLYASRNGKVLAEYSVSVITIPVTSIVLSTNEMELAEGESFQLHYTLFPENASEYGLSWKSANEDVATVSSEGIIEAKSIGQTTVSISNVDGFIATCSVRVKKAIPNFKDLYGKWKGENWFTLADDGSWMKFDTNPNDVDSDDVWLYVSEYLAVNEHLPKVLEDLGFNSAVYEKMNSTSSLMGRQETSNDIAIVSWKYHPDHGLEVLIEVKK